MKKGLLIGLLFLGLAFVGGCAKGKGEISCTVSKDMKYEAAILSVAPAEFEKAGFSLGDSVDVKFGNGFTLEDIPYFNGYYVKNAEPLMVAYPGFNTVQVTFNNLGIWDIAELTEGDTVEIRLNKAKKYSAIQDSIGQVYSFKREDYSSDEEFCNFRPLTGGKLKENFLFRGASPVDNSRGRAPYTDAILKAHSIETIIDLADSEDDIAEYRQAGDFNSPYALSLYEDGDVALLSMGSAYQTQVYAEKFVAGLRLLLENGGPAYIHCMEGKDRTGFTCFLLEALAGATYDELRADYMTTYKNYYQVTPDRTPDKYESIASLYFDAFATYLHFEVFSGFLLSAGNDEVLKKADYTEDAKRYLRFGGMTDEEVERLYQLITK